MRVLVVRPGPHFSVADVSRGWVNGLKQCGVDVVDFNLDDRLNLFASTYVKHKKRYRRAFDAESAARLAVQSLETALYEFWPDVVLVISGFYVHAEILNLIRSRGHKTVLLCTESPYEDDRQLKKAPFYDMVLLNDPTNIEAFKEVNPNTHYVPHAYDPDIHKPAVKPDPEMTSDFFFCGTGYPSRVAFFDQMNLDGIDVKFGGNWQGLDEASPLLKHLVHPQEWCLDNEEATEFYQNTKASINIYRKESERPELEQGWSMGPREVELAATGTFFLRDPRPESDEVLGMLPSFSSPAEASDQLRWWLGHEGERNKVTALAREAVADRTFERNARRLLERFEN